MKTKIRSAFTLIELMIALGLLGALLAVAWSLLGTFRDAEIRGWKLAHRTQTIRSARAWLEDDIQHLALADGNMNSNDSGFAKPTKSSKSSKSARAPQSISTIHFTGNAMGFSARISPSINPIPFLENLMSDSVQADRESPVSESTLYEPPIADGSTADMKSSSPWPAETVEIEYQLTPIASDSVSLTNSLVGISDQTQFVLSRREMNDANTNSVAVNPSERVLTAQDLYRQTDEEILTTSQPIRETRLEGLLKAQFRYFDGSSWKSDWNSQQKGGLPRAIAFGFDFPAVSDMHPPTEQRVRRSDPDGASTKNALLNDFPFADSVLSTEDTAEVATASDQGLMESPTNEVQIVITIGKGNAKRTAAVEYQTQRDLP